MRTVETFGLYSAHPHLARIDELWGTGEGRAYIQRLLSDTRDGERRGFKTHHASIIMKLLVEHDREFPEFDDSLGGTWWLQGLERDAEN